jgi:hypothetical protein
MVTFHLPATLMMDLHNVLATVLCDRGLYQREGGKHYGAQCSV